MGGLGTTATVVISIWVILAFLLLPASGSLRYWTVAFVLLTVVVGAGDHLATRALLAAILGLHVIFVVPAALIGEQRWRFWTAPVSAVALCWLVVTGGRQYWLPALVIGAILAAAGGPWLWLRLRHRSRVDVEVRLWPRTRQPAAGAAEPAAAGEEPAPPAPGPAPEAPAPPAAEPAPEPPAPAAAGPAPHEPAPSAPAPPPDQPASPAAGPAPSAPAPPPDQPASPAAGPAPSAPAPPPDEPASPAAGPAPSAPAPPPESPAVARDRKRPSPPRNNRAFPPRQDNSAPSPRPAPDTDQSEIQ